MANKKISDLTAKGATIAANDRIEIAEYVSPGVYTSKSVLGSELGGVTTFTALTDTPASYTGQTLKFVRVNAGETALEFATVSVSDTNIANTQLTLPTGTRKLIWGGANSTDVLAFRNSTDTKSHFEILGDGQINFNSTTTNTAGVTMNMYYEMPLRIKAPGDVDGTCLRISADGSSTATIKTGGVITLRSEGGVVAIKGGTSISSFFQSVDLYGGTTNLAYRVDYLGKNIFTSNTSFYDGLGGINYEANDKIIVDGFNLAWKNTTSAPSTNITNHFRMYSDDIVAGNAAPHFRTENGSIVKIYQETTGVAASTLVGNAGTALTDTDTFDGYTLKQVVKALRNLGILA